MSLGSQGTPPETKTMGPAYIGVHGGPNGGDPVPHLPLLGDIATSFADSARSYDEFLASLTDSSARSGESRSLKFKSAAEITTMHTFSTALRAQLKKMESVLDAHSDAAMLKTRIEVTSSNGETVFSADDFKVDVGGAVAGSGEGGDGARLPSDRSVRVKDVTEKLRAAVLSWLEDKRQDELYPELLGAYEQWFPVVSKSGEFVSREIFSEPVRGQLGCVSFGEGTLNVRWNVHQHAHIGSHGSPGLAPIPVQPPDITFEPHGGVGVLRRNSLLGLATSVGRRSVVFPADLQNSMSVDSRGQLLLVNANGATVGFELVRGGTERAHEICGMIQKLFSFSEQVNGPQFRVISEQGAGMSSEMSMELDHLVDVVLDSILDGKCTELINKLGAKWEREWPFHAQFARRYSLTSIERLEALPFAGGDGTEVDPVLIQEKKLLDLAKDEGSVEFDEDGGILLRFHAIVAADPASVPPQPAGALLGGTALGVAA